MDLDRMKSCKEPGAARLSVGLFDAQRAELVGVVVFGVPMNQRVVPARLGVPASEGVELSRLVLLDHIPGNAESWFVARAFRALREEKPEVRGVVSYCDPVPRQARAAWSCWDRLSGPECVVSGQIKQSLVVVEPRRPGCF